MAAREQGQKEHEDVDGVEKDGADEPECAAAMAVQVLGRNSPIFLQFFYLFSIFFLNHF
jgi:hypothetical protein